MSNDAFYKKMAATALRLITDKGRTVRGTRYRHAQSDYVTGEATIEVEIEVDFTCVVLPADKGLAGQFNDSFESLTEIFTKTRYLVIAAENAPFIPEAGDVFVFDDYEWLVIGLTPVNPAGTPIVYKVGVRQR